MNFANSQYVLLGQLPPWKSRLVEILREVALDYDFVMIDCPRGLGKATRIALVASHYVVSPIECQELSVKDSQDTLTYVEKVRNRVNARLTFLGFIIT
ncbi:MAG: ParA family protein [Acidobacteria bacterium]|nr:ParA family protein [Acidobacteriota bacterium]